MGVCVGVSECVCVCVCVCVLQPDQYQSLMEHFLEYLLFVIAVSSPPTSVKNKLLVNDCHNIFRKSPVVETEGF